MKNKKKSRPQSGSRQRSGKTIKNRSIKTAIIVGVVVLGLMVPNVVKASVLSEILGSVGKDILYTIGSAINYILNWALKAAGAVFEAILSIGFDSNFTKVAKAGWNVTRDFANMLFILFMIIIAFATILRTEKYGWRQLLPKVIGVALLINFSFVISAAIIDFSNITAKIFVNNIRQNISGTGSITATFADSLKSIGVFAVYTDCEKYKEDAIRWCTETEDLFKSASVNAFPLLKIIKPSWDVNNCLNRAGKLYNECQAYKSITVENEDFKKDATFLNIFLSMTIGAIILLIAAFVLFAGAIMLLIRIIALWFLVMVVPLAFICYIMPGLKQNWQTWWNAFLKWCFFAPIYAFFVWMAMQIAASRTNIIMTDIGIANSNLKPISGNWGATANPFVMNPGAELISYGIIIAFLIGGLIAAQKLSIAGASTAMNIGKKWSKGAGRWVASKTTRYPKELGAAIGAGALEGTGKTLKKIPGFGRFGRGLETRGAMLRRKPEESKEMQDYKKTLEYKSEKNLLEDGKNLSGVMSLANFQKAFEKGVLQKTDDREAIDSAIKAFAAYGLLKEANELKRRRFSTIVGKDDKETKEKMTETYKEGKARGYHKEYKPNMFKGKQGEMAANVIIQTEATAGDAKKILDAMPTDTQEEIKLAIQRNFAAKIDIHDDAEMKRRGAYAAHTGDLVTAFTDSGGLNDTALEKFVAKIKPQHFGDLDIKSIASVAKYANASTLTEAGRHLSTEMKELFAAEFEKRASTDPKFADDLEKTLKKHPGWATFFK